MDTTTISLIIAGASFVINVLLTLIIASNRIGEYKNKVDTACTDITDLKKEKIEIRDKVIACETALFKKVLTRRTSPVNLTEAGDKVLIDSKGKDFVDNNYQDLKQRVDGKKPQTSFDIQEASREVIEGLKKDFRMNEIKDYLFREGMELNDMVEVLGIYLRNKILEEKGVNISDIDNHSKNNA